MRFQTSIVVNRPQEAVFDCVSSVAFIEAIVAPNRTVGYDISFQNRPYVVRRGPEPMDLYQVTEGPVMVGTIFRQGNGRVGSFLDTKIEVIEYEYPNILAFQITSQLIEAQTRYIFEQATDGTRLTMLADMQFRGILIGLIGLLAISLNRDAPQKYGLEVKWYIEEQC